MEQEQEQNKTPDKFCEGARVELEPGPLAEQRQIRSEKGKMVARKAREKIRGLPAGEGYVFQGLFKKWNSSRDFREIAAKKTQKVLPLKKLLITRETQISAFFLLQ